jgi:hypothetical protein
MKAEIDGELPSRTEFCVRQNEIVEIFRWLEVSGGFGDGAGEASLASGDRNSKNSKGKTKSGQGILINPRGDTTSAHPPHAHEGQN